MGEQGINKTNQTYRGIAANKPKLARPPVNGGAPPPTRLPASKQRYNPEPKAFFHDQDCLGPGHIDAIWIVSNDAGRRRGGMGQGRRGGGEMACSRPAMEMDLSAQAWLLIREARALKTAKMEERMEQRLWSSSSAATSPRKYIFPRGVGCCGDQR